jgi:hypothetical protein
MNELKLKYTMKMETYARHICPAAYFSGIPPPELVTRLRRAGFNADPDREALGVWVGVMVSSFRELARLNRVRREELVRGSRLFADELAWPDEAHAGATAGTDLTARPLLRSEELLSPLPCRKGDDGVIVEVLGLRAMARAAS